MTYSRLEPGLPRHPKTLRLMRALGLRRYEAVGLLSMFWCWVQETRPSGALDGIEPADIDASLDWSGVPLGETLIACGWIDRLEDGSLEVHGWAERNEGYERAARERERRKEWRERLESRGPGTGVYVLRRASDGQVKIGWSRNPLRRRAEHVGAHGDLEWIGHIPGDQVLEREMHARWGHLREGSTEWFRPGPDILAWLDDIRDPPDPATTGERAGNERGTSGERRVRGTVSGEERRGEEKKGEDRGSRARDQQDEQVQAVEPTTPPEPDPHGHAEPEDLDRRHATTGRHRLPCTPQAVLDAWERVCVPAGHPRAVATGERASAELLRTVTAALERAPHRGAVWWEGTYLPAVAADPQVGAQTRRQAGPAGIALACREQVISEVLARREASQARGDADDVDSPARIAAIERARAELRGEGPGGATQASPGATQDARPTPAAQPRSTAPPGPRQGARTHGDRQPVRAGQVDLTRALGGGR